MERDFAVRFTNENYASKDEVRRHLNISSIDSIWERVVNYRSYFKKTLELSSIEFKAFSVCITLPLQQRVFSLEKRLIKNMIFLSKLDYESEKVFIENALMIVGRSYAEQDSLTLENNTLISLISDSTSDVPQAYLSLKNYLQTLKHYLNRSASKFDLPIFTSFYGKILRKEINYQDFDSFCRIIDMNNPSDHVLSGRHYHAAPLDKIQSLLSSLIKFNNESRVFTLVKAIITYFYLIYIKPFDYFNEECALLSLKYIIAQDNMEKVPFLLNLEKRLLNVNEEVFKEKFILSELSGDLTYFVNYIFDIIESSVDEFDELVSQNEIRVIKDEFSQTDEVFVEKKTSVNPTINNFTNSNPVVFEQKVSMPTFPVGLDEKDVNLIAENLLELYPSLKKNQAKFYASHCTIGKYYSIAQYKKETGVAYETARTSMDNLVNLGFYRKEQIKNKYVYTPVVR